MSFAKGFSSPTAIFTNGDIHHRRYSLRAIFTNGDIHKRRYSPTAIFANGDIHRSLGQRPRPWTFLSRGLANGHIQKGNAEKSRTNFPNSQ
jgi:hypothetical protein